ncbi:MAG: peptidoglycan-binding protein [Actinomycetota bacterium]|nr:peptidoglycan-binding protein [Actinomycetota bacterium]
MSAAWQIVIDVARANRVYHGEPSHGQTTGGEHSANSWHYPAQHGGHAADCGISDCDPGAVFRLFEPLARTGAVRELFYDPLGGYKTGRSVGAIGGHGTHCHVTIQPGREAEVAALGRDFAPGERTIRQGSRGPDVAAWQRHLRIGDDGVFGSGTRKATIEYQRSRGLTADGVVGPQSWAAYHRDLDSTQPPPPRPMAGRIAAGAKGIDVSHHQRRIDWHAVKAAGYTFAIIRASYGGGPTDLDRNYHLHRDGAREAGLVLGHYHYAYPTGPDAIDEADHFIRTVGAVPPGELVVLDLEEGSGDISRWALQFLGHVEKAHGRRPILYGYPAFLQVSALDPHCALCPLWVAHYNVQQPSVPPPWRSAVLWQQSKTGQVPGVAGDCDVNIALADVPVECFGGAVEIPQPPPSLPEEDDMLMFWHQGGLYLLSGGRRSPAGLPPHLADQLAAAGVQRIGSPNEDSPLFDMLPPFMG